MILLVQVNYREEEFKDAVSKWTNGTGVNIILDCIGGRLSPTIPREKTETWGTVFSHLITWFLLHSYSTGNLASLATDGRWVVYGLMGGPEVFSSSWHFCCLLTVVVCVAYWLTMGSVSSKLQARTQHGCQQSSSTVTVSSPVTPLPCFVQYIFITFLSLMILVRCQVLCWGVFYEKGLLYSGPLWGLGNV